MGSWLRFRLTVLRREVRSAVNCRPDCTRWLGPATHPNGGNPGAAEACPSCRASCPCWASPQVEARPWCSAPPRLARLAGPLPVSRGPAPRLWQRWLACSRSARQRCARAVRSRRSRLRPLPPAPRLPFQKLQSQKSSPPKSSLLKSPPSSYSVSASSSVVESSFVCTSSPAACPSLGS